jgi:hypothetical protein
MTVSKTVALPLGYAPICNLEIYHKWLNLHNF